MSPETREFLASIRSAEDPGPADESRVLAALEARIATPPAEPGPPGTHAGVTGAGVGLKGIAALCGVSAGAALLAFGLSSEPATPSPAPATPRATTALTPQPSGAARDVVRAPPPGAAAPSQSDAPASPSIASVRGATAPSVSGDGRQPRARPEGPASLRDEIALLAEVQAALEEGDGAKALKWLDGHVTGDRQLLAERRAARIAALCQIGRVLEARQLAAVFFRENAQSVQRAAVERSCAATKTDSAR